MTTLPRWEGGPGIWQRPTLRNPGLTVSWTHVVSRSICSDSCGAADLIHNGFNGKVFRCDSLKSLTGVLEEWISKGPLNDKRMRQIISWSRCVEGEAVARYFR